MSEETDELREKLVVFMATNKLKKTQQRDLIFDCFVQGGHVSVDGLLARVQLRHQGVGYATVYRTLKLFVAAGVAHERRFDDGQARYEPVEIGDEHHDHLICQRCGQIFEFEDDIIETRQKDIATRFGLKLVSHRMTLWGECIDNPDCVDKSG